MIDGPGSQAQKEQLPAASSSNSEENADTLAATFELGKVTGESASTLTRAGLVSISATSPRVLWEGTFRLPSETRTQLSSRAASAPGYAVNPGFPRSHENLLFGLAEDLFTRVGEWPELKGVRATVRLYRFASAEERDLDLVRVELRIPGVDLVQRFPLWRKLRAEVESILDEPVGEGRPAISRHDARVLREAISTILVG